MMEINTLMTKKLMKTRFTQLSSRMLLYVSNKIRKRIEKDISELFQEMNISEIYKWGMNDGNKNNRRNV